VGQTPLARPVAADEPVSYSSGMSRAGRAVNQLRALWKYCLSFRKRDWELSDYPIWMRRQVPNPARMDDDKPRFTAHPYAASIVNWHLSGTGNSYEEALSDLRSSFAGVKANRLESGEPLPRPGSRAPIRFALQDRVNADPDLRDDFIHRVLGFEWAFISDESSLWDFHTERTNDQFVAKIKEVYGVDVSDIESAPLCEILGRIGARKRSDL
jgi:hypothetical protein